MACLFLCSCGDHLDDASVLMKWDAANDSLIDAAGYNGTKCFTYAGPPYTRVRLVKKVTPAPVTRLVWGFRWKSPPDAFPLTGFSWWPLTALHYGAGPYDVHTTKQLSINIEPAGELSVHRGSYTGTLLGTSAPVLDDLAWQYVECDVTIGASGAVILRVDNTVVLALSGVNTQALGAAAISAVEIIPWIIDDVYVNDGSGPRHTGFFGRGFHVAVTRPVADARVEWLPTSGANYSNVDDAAPDGVASQVTTQFPGEADLYQLATVPAGAILAIQGNACASRASASVPATLAQIVDIDGVTYSGPLVAPGTTILDYRAIWPVAPDDGQPWTPAKINAARWGLRRVS